MSPLLRVMTVKSAPVLSLWIARTCSGITIWPFAESVATMNNLRVPLSDCQGGRQSEPLLFRSLSLPPDSAILPGTIGRLMSLTDDSAGNCVSLDFESLVASYYRSLYKFAFSLTQAEAEACDL